MPKQNLERLQISCSDNSQKFRGQSKKVKSKKVNKQDIGFYSSFGYKVKEV